jgi:Tol biopolymer transport system component
VTPVIVVPTATALNQATAAWEAQVATAQAVVFGTATPWPPNIMTATPTPPPPLPTPTPYFVPLDLLAPTPTMTPTPQGIPEFLKGKIMFYSDRTGKDTIMFMNPDGSEVNVWQGDNWVYEKVRELASFSPDHQFRAVVQHEQVPVEQIFLVSMVDGNRSQLTHFDALSYDPVWSPTSNTIAFVSPQADGDEIYKIQTDGTGLQRLTENTWEWDKHPSWSPDGSQIVFWSNRETSRKQIWLMNADGSSPRNISNSEYNDWDPVWVR